MAIKSLAGAENLAAYESSVCVVSEINITHAALLLNKSWPTASKIMNNLAEIGILQPVTKRGKVRDSTKTYRLEGRPDYAEPA